VRPKPRVVQKQTDKRDDVPNILVVLGQHAANNKLHSLREILSEAAQEKVVAANIARAALATHESNESKYVLATCSYCS
jgi:hypothetical protein